MKMKVYRIEHSESGHGPYTAKVLNDELDNLLLDMKISHCSSNHPSLLEDFHHSFHKFVNENGMPPMNKILFGFESEKKMKEWFGKYLSDLIHSGEFQVVSIEVEKYLFGRSGKQLLFIDPRKNNN